MTTTEVASTGGSSRQYNAKKPCTATAHRTGERCRRPAEPGTTVCKFHGGKAPQVVNKAKLRLMEAADRMARELLGIADADFDELPPAVKLAAIRDALDRAGLSAKQLHELEVSVKPWEQAIADAWQPGDSLVDADVDADDPHHQTSATTVIEGEYTVHPHSHDAPTDLRYDVLWDGPTFKAYAVACGWEATGKRATNGDERVILRHDGVQGNLTVRWVNGECVAPEPLDAELLLTLIGGVGADEPPREREPTNDTTTTQGNDIGEQPSSAGHNAYRSWDDLYGDGSPRRAGREADASEYGGVP